MTILPNSLIKPLPVQLVTAKQLHEHDMASGYGAVRWPCALERKYPHANQECIWLLLLGGLPLLLANPPGAGAGQAEVVADDPAGPFVGGVLSSTHVARLTHVGTEGQHFRAVTTFP